MADRKSTRLNSSHLVISYAVFCLKKKKQTQSERPRCAPTVCCTDVQPAHSRDIQFESDRVADTPSPSIILSLFCFFFFFNDTATTEIYTLSLHDALPI